MPLSTGDFFKKLQARTRASKDSVRASLEELHKQNKIIYDAFPGMKEKVVFPSLKNKLQENIKIKGEAFYTNDKKVKIFIGYSDLQTIGQIAKVVGFRGNAEGFQRMKQRSWVLELSHVFETEEIFLFTSIVLYLDETKVKQEDGGLILPTSNIISERDKPALIVDGQQRCQAFHELVISEQKTDVLKTPIVIILGTFKEKELMEFLRLLFVNANRTKPLPSSLINQLLATIEDLENKTIVSSSKKGGRFSKIVQDIDENENSVLWNKIGLEKKGDPKDYPLAFNVLNYQVKYLNNYLLNFVNREMLNDELIKNVVNDIYAAIYSNYTQTFDLILKDVRAIGPLFFFLSRNISTEILFSDDRKDRLSIIIERIADYITLTPNPKKIRSWLDIGDWNPEKLGDVRNRPALEKAAQEIHRIYINILRSERN